MKLNIFVALVSVLGFISCDNSPKQEDVAPQRHQDIVEYVKLTPTEFRIRLADAPIAYLPLGTIEWHGEHMPLGSDGLQSFEFFKLLAEKSGGIVFPMMYLGPDTMIVRDGKELHGVDHSLSTPGSKEYSPMQQLDGQCFRITEDFTDQIIEETVKLAARAGFKIIVAHGHGPSTSRVIKHWQEWEKKYDVMIYTCWSWNVRGGYDKVGDDLANTRGVGIMTDHAARNETSLMMYFFPELVHIDRLPSDSTKWPVGMSGVDPRFGAANPELGKESVDYHLERMDGLLTEALKSIK
ncbi:MAG: creatininase family protein [Chlamydiia bacterium]|nr:creatininase family protein [Chlamydiia bacterium]